MRAVRTLIVLATATIVSGCGLCPLKPTTVTVVEYVSTKIPPDHLVIPDQVRDIDPSTATQRDVAAWIVESEKRTVILEDKLRAISEFENKIIENLEKNER